MKLLSDAFRVILKPASAAILLSALSVFVAVPEVYADHSLQKACIVCHSLRSANVVPGSRNISGVDDAADPLFDPWRVDAASQPLDCSFCHKSDIGFEIMNANGGKHRGAAGIGSAHPVDVVGDNMIYPAGVKITCFDCHNGNNSGLPAGETGNITPKSPTSKSENDGYPNHLNINISPTVLPGENDLAKNRPYLSYKYGPLSGSPDPSTPGVDWTKSTFLWNDMLCFVCHDRNPATKPPYTQNLAEDTWLKEDGKPYGNILAEYNMTGGGHNVANVGLGVGGVQNKKLPCYSCHDPHSGTDLSVPAIPRINKALITVTPPTTDGINNIVNPYFPAEGTPFTSDNYNYSYLAANSTNKDRALCTTCHLGSGRATVEGSQPVALETNATHMKFGFHANAHATAISSGNCLQKNGGCHQSPHNTSPFDCLGCHSFNNVNYASFPPELKRVASVDSEFDIVLDDKITGAPVSANIRSMHNIPYNPAGDLSSRVDNGCLSCHNVPFDQPGNKVALPYGTTQFTPPNMSDVKNLKDYNAFCLGCHDGSTASERKFGALSPPQVDKYYLDSGHGTGLGAKSFESGNPDAKVACLECHMYHGSTAHKLLPGNAQTTTTPATVAGLPGIDMGEVPYKKAGRVVKGFIYSNNTRETTGTLYTLGSVPNSLSIDYRDYTIRANNTTLPDDRRRSWKFADYQGDPWNTYYLNTNNSTNKPANPVGTVIQFGTTGDMTDPSKLGCSALADTAGIEEIGFCNSCHFSDKDNSSQRGTVDPYTRISTDNKGTMGWVYTHEGLMGETNCQARAYPSKREFQKDCSDCHDPHGSGADSTVNPNWYMIRGKIITATDATSLPTGSTWNVVLDDPGSDGIFIGNNSLVDTNGDNSTDICAVCHTSTNYNKRAVIDAQPHYTGQNCTNCHPHGSNKARPINERLRAWLGFTLPNCNGCHGFPPMRPGTAGNVAPPEENYTDGGGPHVEHVNFLAAKNNLPYNPIQVDADPKLVCGPCHGDGAGVTNHPDSGNGGGSWASLARTFVNIAARNAPADSWGSSGPRYGGLPIPTTAANAVMSMDNSRCQSLDCHNDSAGTKVSWYITSHETTSTGDLAQVAPNRTRVCYDCHRYNDKELRVYNLGGTQVYGRNTTSGVIYSYDPKTMNAAANYFGTVSGYGRGGHGDPNLSPPSNFETMDPDSGHNITVASPIDCTKCHDKNAQHIPPAAANRYRLKSTVVEDSGHSSSGICNDCHAGADYPGTAPSYRHHPSFVPLSFGHLSKAIGQDWNSGTVTWEQSPGGVYVQNKYGLGALSQPLVDNYIDWYNHAGTSRAPGSEDHSQTPAPRGVYYNENGANNSAVKPKVVLPLSKNIISGNSTNTVICTTCHNPHGTDLYVYDPTGKGKDINDNNMLRLRDTDNTLCLACH